MSPKQRLMDRLEPARAACRRASGDMRALCRAALLLSIAHEAVEAVEFRRVGSGSPSRTLGAGAGA